jgi:hypothetical protein
MPSTAKASLPQQLRVEGSGANLKGLRLGRMLVGVDLREKAESY